MTGFDRLNLKAQNTDQGAIRTMFDKAAKMTGVISMGIGEPCQNTNLAICKACADALMSGNTHYAPNAGILTLRKAISKNGFIAKDFFDPETEIMVTNGGMGAFALIMQVILEPGDEVLIQDPQYLNFQKTVSYCGGVAVPVPTTFESGFCMDAEEIRRRYVKGKTKMLIVNSPNNPTGEVVPEDKLREIAKVAVELDLLVLSDEVYGQLLYDGAKPLSIAEFPGMKERTIVVNSFSKAYAMTGWRLGYVAGPRGIIDRMTKVQEYFNSCINTPAQHGAVFALEHPEFIEEIRKDFEERRKIAIEGFSSINGITPNTPKGAFYLFPDIKGTGMDSTTFCNRLLDEAKVVCVPGNAFGECGEGYMRVSYSGEKASVIEAIERIRKFCNNI
ncbi:MAG: pyridoxal phosphate-dependent aminotransferase [Ruminococcaceae bacterium]|nr:pyridoxal phosphate-dependent aminotransferase [Oscillospiraceae bacterium]